MTVSPVHYQSYGLKTLSQGDLADSAWILGNEDGVEAGRVLLETVAHLLRGH